MAELNPLTCRPCLPRSEGLLKKLPDPLPPVESVPWLCGGMAEDACCQRAVVLPRIGHQFDRHASLAKGAVHLLRLPHRIGHVALTLQQQEGRLRLACAGQRALPPRVLLALPRLAKV